MSLLFALLAFVESAADLVIPLVGRLALIPALLSFVLAAGLALGSNTPREYVTIANEDLRRMTGEDLWVKAELAALRRITENRVETLIVARRINTTKATMLQFAIAAETLGVAFIALSVAILLLRN